ncbi:hypothetical protein LZZ90_00640 [Flavobacterium sp. SM15]|uniref:hypothetical protein n=1 Tax=Flavobacterium sp. SM15 TaxID=2908005 RepID=UPI001EDAE9E9|nr:hypothetical protein [Flavobacterium sp. SM15]MCG2610009.1 hypothetical protein [Flavobacterium sp. SM15]
MYLNIEKYSKKGKFTKFLHKLIFEPVAKQELKNIALHKIKKQHYTQSEGKIIRRITITTLDPFGYSEVDSTEQPKQYIARAGNSLHLKTRDWTIKNILLLKENTLLDSLLAKESERLIRSQRYVRGVKITTELSSESSDSVDVYVRVLDSWSLIPVFSISSSKSTFDLTERNFFGTGHEFLNAYTNSLNSSRNGYNTSYTIPSILNTFIKATLLYKVDLEDYYLKSVNVERPFFSPYTRWGAGAYLDKQYVKITSFDRNQVAHIQNFKFVSQDYWAGHAFQIFKGNTEYERITNLITSARYYTKNYLEKSEVLADSLGIFTNENLYLVAIGISSRKFTQDKFIFNYNTIEDVASGILYNITSGYQRKNGVYKFYSGARFAMGKYYKFGYLSGSIEYGTFFKDSKAVQNALNFNAVYFTNLYQMGNWKFRQFIKPQLIAGANRLESNSDKLTLNENPGIEGFKNQTLFGTKRFLLTFQTQGYSPWKVLGFRLNPYLSFTMGALGQKNSGFKSSKIYSQLGAGIIISNDYLVFNAFQFSFSYYPNLPMDAGSEFKTNAIKTYDFGLQSFEISKPLLVPYQ